MEKKIFKINEIITLIDSNDKSLSYDFEKERSAGYQFILAESEKEAIKAAIANVLTERNPFSIMEINQNSVTYKISKKRRDWVGGERKEVELTLKSSLCVEDVL